MTRDQIAEHRRIVDGSEWRTAVVNCTVAAGGITMIYTKTTRELEDAGWLFVGVGEIHPSQTSAVVIFRRAKR
jgi:hypothetical protein